MSIETSAITAKRAEYQKTHDEAVAALQKGEQDFALVTQQFNQQRERAIGQINALVGAIQALNDLCPAEPPAETLPDTFVATPTVPAETPTDAK